MHNCFLSKDGCYQSGESVLFGEVKPLASLCVHNERTLASQLGMAAPARAGPSPTLASLLHK